MLAIPKKIVTLGYDLYVHTCLPAVMFSIVHVCKQLLNISFQIPG